MIDENPHKRIKVTQKKNLEQSYTIWCSHDFFTKNKEVVFEMDEWSYSFRVPSIDDKNRRRVSDAGLTGYTIAFSDSKLEEGYFEIDLEYCTEDKIVFSR